jgi:hypothetical protein
LAVRALPAANVLQSQRVEHEAGGGGGGGGSKIIAGATVCTDIIVLFFDFVCMGTLPVRSNVILADCWEERIVFARDYHPEELLESIAEEAQHRRRRRRRRRRSADDPNSETSLEEEEQDDDPTTCQRTVRRQLAQAMIPGPALVSIAMDRNAFEMRTQQQEAAIRPSAAVGGAPSAAGAAAITGSP